MLATLGGYYQALVRQVLTLKGRAPLARVEREISSSSSVMSTSISAKRGVLRYHSPVSGNIQRTVAPLGASSQIRSALAKVAPAVIPTKIPSFASCLLQCIASARQ